MCRLLGWTGTTPRTAAGALGPDAFDAFVNLGRFHRDGWGLAWWPNGSDAAAAGGPSPTHPDVLKAPTTASEDPEMRRAGEDLVTDAGIAHLRWATPNMPIMAANCHPFVRGNLAMAHNGGIYPQARLNEILPPEWEARLIGSTDSERYVLSVLIGTEGGTRTVADSLADVVTTLFAGWSPSSLNAVCLTPDALIAVCAYDPDIPPGRLPQTPDVYYRLRWRADEHGVVVASSGFDQATSAGWSTLGNMAMLIAPRSGAAPEIRPLDVALPTEHADPVVGSSDVR
jgi:predicted glutamine amidotransferase